MKKTYMKPEMALYRIELQQMIAVSGPIIQGKDTGSADFVSLGRDFGWDDEDEE